MKHFNQKPASVYKAVCDSYILNMQIYRYGKKTGTISESQHTGNRKIKRSLSCTYKVKVVFMTLFCDISRKKCVKR